MRGADADAPPMPYLYAARDEAEPTMFIYAEDADCLFADAAALPHER